MGRPPFLFKCNKNNAINVDVDNDDDDNGDDSDDEDDDDDDDNDDDDDDYDDDDKNVINFDGHFQISSTSRNDVYLTFNC